MRAPISVIIPTLNAGEELPACLMALGEGLKAGVIRELIVSDGGSTDTTLKTARAAGARIVEGAPSRGGQLRRGARVAEGDWLLFLHADTQLAADWPDRALGHVSQDKAAFFRLCFRSRHPMARVTEGWANLRARYLDLPYGDQGLLISRALYEEVGGYPDTPLMEDVTLARALKGRLTMLDARALTSAARYQQEGWLRRGFGNLVLLSRFLMGASPQALAARYRKSG